MRSAAIHRTEPSSIDRLPGVLRPFGGRDRTTVAQRPAGRYARFGDEDPGLEIPSPEPVEPSWIPMSRKYSFLRGRLFGAEDAPGSPPAILVSESMARRYWRGGEAVGSRIRISPHTAEEWGTVVGVVRDVRVDPALPEPRPMAYATNRQDNLWNGRDFLVRTGGNPAALVRLVERELAALDPAVPLRDPTPLRAIVDERMSGRRLPVLLMTAFGTLALLLASVGIYALFASLTVAREREFGVRVALGSTRRSIALLVLRQGAIWMGVGLVGGVMGVALVSRVLRDLLYGVGPLDPIAFGVAFLALTACAAAALLVPVRRATRVDPMTILH